MLPFLLSVFAPHALAVSPSPLQMGAYNVYLGVSHGKWSQFRANGDPSNLPAPVTDKGVTAYYAVGVSDRMDIGLNIPVQQTSMGEGAPSGEMYASTTGLAATSVNSRILIAREGDALPLTISGIGSFRVGSYHAETRDRLTNIGEGSIDFGAGLLLGRVLLAGPGTLWIEAGGQYWRRIPASFGTTIDKYPGDDITYSSEVGYSFHPKVGVAAVVDGYQRLSGVDYPALANDSTIPVEEQWTALRGAQMKAGGKLNFYATEKFTVSSSYLTAVSAVNNPIDERVIGFGVSYYRPNTY